jgi:hypothetical protein
MGSVKNIWVFFSGLILLWSVNTSAQHFITEKADSSYWADKVDSLCTIFCNRKDIPEKFLLPALVALSHYPSLENTRIKFRERSIRTTLNVRPTFFSSVFRSPANRLYVVRVNNNPKSDAILYNEVPFQALIGLLGHEFAHIKDFNSVHFMGLVQRAFWYASDEKKSAYEKYIDEITICHGLGTQLHEWSHYVINESKAPDNYKEMKKRRYMTPTAIRSWIE